MIGSHSEKTEARCLVEAAAWRTQLTEADQSGSPEFNAWLAADPRHRSAWEQVEASWNFIENHQASPELLELRRIALTRVRGAAQRRWRPSFSIPMLFAAAAVFVLAVVGAGLWMFYGSEVYSTKTGERRMITLSDGSQLQLDASTELRVSYSAHARELTLLRGQARFDVAHDVERPFSVVAGGQKVVATGTAFNVDLMGSKVLVTLIEGHVVVLQGAKVLHSREGSAALSSAARRNHGPPRQGIELEAGQELIAANGSSAVIPANVSRITSWQSGQIVFEDESLATVVQRMNRYSPQTLILQDERVAELHISGVFKTNDIPGFVDTLTRYMPVVAQQVDGTIQLSYH